jgi:putative serine protease PepD
MPNPKHLWTGDWRDTERPTGQATQQQPAEPRPAAAPPTPPEPPRRRPRTLIACGLAAVAAGAGAVGYAVLDDGGNGANTQAARTLPAAKANPLTPKAGQTPAGAVYAKAAPAVVSIRTSTGTGTGFLVEDRQTIVTNAHVVDGSTSVTVRFGAAGRDLRARVLGTDTSTDLSVLRLEEPAPANAHPLALANSDDVGVGDDVVAIGNPFGLDRTLTEGIVSALGREIQAPNGFAIPDAIQTDAPINPGNSGGPLLDRSARVIGVNSQIETGGGSNGNVGIGFAVSSNTVREVLPKLEQGGEVQHAWLGVATEGLVSGGSGARIAQIVPDSPADDAHLQLGDSITSFGGDAVSSPSDLTTAVNRRQTGDKVDVVIRRGDQQRTVTVTLGTRPSKVP